MQIKRIAFGTLMGIASLPMVTACSVGGTSSAGSTSLAPNTTIATASTAAPTTTVAPTTTAAPTTTLPRVLQSFELIKVLPRALDLPAGWTSVGGDPKGGFNFAEGNYMGICGGKGADDLAVAAGARSSADSPYIKGPDGGYAWVWIYSFASVENARKFMTVRSDAAQCYSEYKVVEGDKEGQFDGFGGKYGEGRVKWNVQESRTVGGADVQSADESFLESTQFVYDTRVGGRRYASKQVILRVLERHGSVVIGMALEGDCCFEGFSNVRQTDEYIPTLAGLAPLSEKVRKRMLSSLVELGVDVHQGAGA